MPQRKAENKLVGSAWNTQSIIVQIIYGGNVENLRN